MCRLFAATLLKKSVTRSTIYGFAFLNQFTGWAFYLTSLCEFICFISPCPSVDQNSRPNPWTLHRFCSSRLKHCWGLFSEWKLLPGGWPGVTVIATGVHSFILPTALTLLISCKYSFGWHLGGCLKWKLKHDMHNSASPVVGSFYFLGREIGNKTRQTGIKPDLIYVQVFHQLIILYILVTSPWALIPGCVT